MSPHLLKLVWFATISCVSAQNIELVSVQSKKIDRTTNLPGEILPFQRVSLHARVNGYVDRVLVDRGSKVTQGQLLAAISAPEVAAVVAEAEFRAQAAESTRVEAAARLAAVHATYERLKKAAETPGSIAGNELVLAEKVVDAAKAAVLAAEGSVRAAQATVSVAKQSEQYLQVIAPFSGVITERLVHPGALVGPGNGAQGTLLELVQISKLRLVVAIPETLVAGIRQGAHVNFRVPAYPTRTFSGIVARVDRSLDPKTRTMPVELDVTNNRNELSPGMYPDVAWPSTGSEQSLLAPPTAVVTTTERTFVIRSADGQAQWVNVRKGNPSGELVEVFGPLKPGEQIVRRANDEIREGTRLLAK